MAKISIICFVTLFLGVNAYADVKSSALEKVSSKVSSTVSNLIPGEGLTEVDVKLRDNNEGHGNVEFQILGVRDIFADENYNMFTQFSLHTQEVNNDNRYIGNLGLGYRVLNSDQSMMIGSNFFYDADLTEKHQRMSYGIEAKAAMLDFSFNHYLKTTNMKVISGTKEQVLSGQEYNISSQVPYIPWTTFNFQGYRMENELAAQDIKGNIYSLEMALSPSLEFDVLKDVSSVDGQKDEWEYILTFTHPPRENKANLLINGLTSDELFEKKNMQAALKDKVRRNNNLAVEIQGSVIFTSK